VRGPDRPRQTGIQPLYMYITTLLTVQGTAVNKSLTEIGKLLQMWLSLSSYTQQRSMISYTSDGQFSGFVSSCRGVIMYLNYL